MQRLALLVTGVLLTLSLVRAQGPGGAPPAPPGPYVPTAFVTVPGGAEAARPGPADPGQKSPMPAVQPLPQRARERFDHFERRNRCNRGSGFSIRGNARVSKGVFCAGQAPDFLKQLAITKRFAEEISCTGFDRLPTIVFKGTRRHSNDRRPGSSR